MQKDFDKKIFLVRESISSHISHQERRKEKNTFKNIQKLGLVL